MTQIDVVPIMLKNVLLTLGATAQYEKHVSAVTLTPSSSIETWKGLDNNPFSFPSTPTWTCDLEYAQDWETPDSLSAFLFDHQGEVVPATFEPVAGGAGWLADLIIVPGSIGGTVDAVAVSTVTCGVQGAPTRAA